MGSVASQVGASFVLSTGDNVYENGVTSASDPLWAATFSDIYTHPSLADVPFYAVAGNHDWRGNVSAQVDPTAGVCCVAPAGSGVNGTRARVPDARWRAAMSFQATPARARSDHWAGVPPGQLPGGKIQAVNPPLLSLIYVDTSPWVAEYRADGSMNWGGAGIIPSGLPRGSAAEGAAWAAWEAAQINRLTAALAASDARWKIVVGHHAVLSYGEHGSQRELSRLDAALRAGGAVAYVNGHDHDLQLIQPDAAPAGAAAATSLLGPLYLTSGAGSAVRGDVRDPLNGTLLHFSNSCGFHVIEVGRDTLRIHAHDGVSGARLHTHARAWQPPPACGAAGAAAADARCRASAGAGR
jgi:tartrate-resistant acid phosphatase type 5